MSIALPDFPWDTIAEARAKAESHPDGIVDLSVGTPVDPVAPGIQLALSQAAAAPGYPATAGTPELQQAIKDSLARRYGMTGIERVLPVVGTKEAIAWLPTVLGLGKGDTVVIPELAYPTYEVGAILGNCEVVRSDAPVPAALMYVNSPSNPTGAVRSAEELRELVQFARAHKMVLASDECYLGLGWGTEPVSILDPEVCGGDHTGLIAIHSLSKTSNMASYRAGYFAGDPELISKLLTVRKHAGLMVPGPIQAAMVAALTQDDHEQVQKLVYAKRRAGLLEAVVNAGFTVDHSEAGLYLWATRGEACRATVDWFAERGILVAPGEFYGPSGQHHVRIALTATNERIDAAISRLA